MLGELQGIAVTFLQLTRCFAGNKWKNPRQCWIKANSRSARCRDCENCRLMDNNCLDSIVLRIMPCTLTNTFSRVGWACFSGWPTLKMGSARSFKMSGAINLNGFTSQITLIFIYIGDVGLRVLRNVCNFVPEYTTSHSSRTQDCSHPDDFENLRSLSLA